ncbi:MAG: DsbA family protein [Candidatus Pacearchaeota archaeon]
MEETKSDKNPGKYITLKKSDLWKYSTILLLIVLFIIGAVYFFNKLNISGKATTIPPSNRLLQVSVDIDNDAILGDKNAPITIIEFSDYQCPFCRKFWSETYPLLKSNYIETGKVRLVFRDFPISSLHPMAQPSAEAAECVREKGGDLAYYRYHDKIFEEQNKLDSGNPKGPVTRTVSYTADDLKRWAREIGYNIDSCLDSRKFSSEVQKDLNDAAAAGVEGTPYFIIMKSGDTKGTPLSGAHPYSEFEKIIESLLQS